MKNDYLDRPEYVDKQMVELNQVNLSRRFVMSEESADWIYVPEWGAWTQWVGNRWEKSMDESVIRSIGRVVEDLQKDPETARKEAVFYNRNLSYGALNSIAKLSKPDMEMSHTAFETHLGFFNVKNGVINLSSGGIIAHNRKDLHRFMSPVEYDKKATCPRWEQFLGEVTCGNKELQRFLQRMVGYVMSGYTTEQCLFMLLGGGANGKSVFLSTIRSLMGDYGATSHSKAIMKKFNDSNTSDLAALEDRRYVEIQETELGARLAEGLVKSYTGGEAVPCRFLNKEWFSYVPKFKMLIATNHTPVVHGTDQGIWRRVKLIPFKLSIPIEERDHRLAERLRAELPGILNWAIAGYRSWKEIGLQDPPIVQMATDDYRTEMDPIHDFIMDVCDIDEHGEVPASVLYTAYNTYRKDEGFTNPPSGKAFARMIQDKNFGRVRKSRGYYYTGLKFKPSLDPSPLF
jgi:putative DNA primase/helicase